MMDACMAVLVILVLGAIAHWHPMELGPKANPADTQYVPRPEWYYLPVFQWLKYFKGGLAFVGIVVIPVVTSAIILFLPFYDRRLERRPWKRPIAVGIFTAIMLTLIFFGWLSGHEDQKDPAIAKQVEKQRTETEEFMHAPFTPESAGSTISAASQVVLDPAAAAGKKVYEGEACDSCHGENGVGTSNGPKLSGKIAAIPAEELTNVLHNPTPAMVEGGMQAVAVSDEDLKALVTYIKSLK
jgi:ubiquinol-cytochrome c reductase cytochrome b subunit